MKKQLSAAVAVAVVALACVAAASAASQRDARGARIGKAASVADAPPITWGVADDASKYAADGGKWFYGQMKGASLASNRWVLAWDASNPTAITELPFLQRALPQAQAAGIHVVLSLYAGKNGTSEPDATNHDPTAFCNWVKLVGETVKPYGVRDFIIWNEPSSTLYWSPQKDASGADVAAPAYEALLAQCYDQLHSLDGGGWTANVIGMGLSAKAATTSSNQPLAFLRDVGAAYRASGRTKPIMDQLALHPYPIPSSNPSPSQGYANTPDAYGPPDLARVKQAVYDAFNGTGQPTTLNGLTFRLDEYGVQTIESGAPYTGTENAGPPGSAAAVSEAAQTTFLQQSAQMFACDPTVTDVELFLLVDESNLAGWQSGLETAGGEGVSRQKPAYSAMAPIFASGRGACTSGLTAWSPSGPPPAAVSAGGTGNSGGQAAPLPAVTVAIDAFTDVLVGLSGATDQISQTLGHLQPLNTIVGQAFANAFTPVVTSFLSAMDRVFGKPQVALALSTFVVRSGSTLHCGTLSRVLVSQGFDVRCTAARGAKGRLAIVARSNVTVKAHQKLNLKLKLKKGKLAAGSYYAVVAARTLDKSKAGYVVVKIATVKARRSLPVCKKGQKSTKKHPCAKPKPKKLKARRR